MTFRRVRKIAKSDLVSSYLSVSASVRMEQLGPYWTDFHEMRYLSIFKTMSRKFKFH